MKRTSWGIQLAGVVAFWAGVCEYLVLNSGPTFRENHDRTNSLQNPKLGDWAVLDLRTPPDGRSARKVVASGVFDARWE